MLSFQAKRELLAQVAPRYREASHAQKSVILDEFVAATGYRRKYAIRLLSQPPSSPAPIRRSRARHYGRPVQDALKVAWAAVNFICAKRLIPFLPELIPVLERHGHLQLSAELRELLLAMSPSTGERLLAAIRREESPRGLTTTKPGKLLKHQIPIRTFNDWNEKRPGFFEGDSVAHCGWSIEGDFLYSLVLTDVATGWTECLALLHRGETDVLQALDRVRQLLPFPMLGLDTDNGCEFINDGLLTYCEREQLTFTRGRVAKKNDQCYVEQKNGNIVRQHVGYDRLEGKRAYRQLVELYRALRLYVNFFQPSMKLAAKHRDGSKIQRKYDSAQTPLQRLLATDVLTAEARARLVATYQALDPVRLLRQVQILQDALWQLAVVRAPTAPTSEEAAADATARRFDRAACGLGSDDLAATLAVIHDASNPPGLSGVAQRHKRHYRHTKKTQAPRYWRTRPDPFAEVWDEVCEWLSANPERTAKAAFLELQRRYPGKFSDGQMRTLQRHVHAWRAKVIVTFDEQWLQDEIAADQPFPRPLQAVIAEDDTAQDVERQSVHA
jgi:hypothetical protein